MSALGQKRTYAVQKADVRFTPESDIGCALLNVRQVHPLCGSFDPSIDFTRKHSEIYRLLICVSCWFRQCTTQHFLSAITRQDRRLE